MKTVHYRYSSTRGTSSLIRISSTHFFLVPSPHFFCCTVQSNLIRYGMRGEGAAISSVYLPTLSLFERKESDRVRESWKMPIIEKLYSMKEVAEHNSDDDCWIVVDGKVYDVSSYLDEHPGGGDVLISATGKDATEEFEEAGHSRDAKELMKDFCIGELDTSIPEMEVFRKESSFFSSNEFKYGFAPFTAVAISALVAYLYARNKQAK
ncbi:hypothetical protein LUZ60_010114 [Juncus effusus]|nr:hypothetical protein LUZ60_010114 [Juncus effusus]